MRTALLLALLCFVPFAYGDDPAPDGYQCAPGTPSIGKGCNCPRGRISARKRDNIAICVVAATYEVTIEVPDDAVVSWEGETRVGRFTEKWKAGTKLSLLIVKDGYRSLRRDIRVTKTETIRIVLEREPDRKVTVSGDANLKDADVFVNGELRGRAPVVLSLASGKHHVEVKKRGFETFAKDIEVARRDSVLEVVLVPAPHITIEGGTNLAGARVVLDGFVVGVAPTTIDSTRGRHTVDIAKDGFEDWHSGSFELGAESKTLSVVLKPVCPADMISIPAGTFWMGPNGDASQHKVSLASYCIDKTEVTVKAYQACVTSGVCKPAAKTIANPPSAADPAFREKWSRFCNGDPAHPMNCVDWSQAELYCSAVKKRLPTEQEWEYAARGSDGRKFPWGNQPPGPKIANLCDGSCAGLFRMLDVPWSALYPAEDGAWWTAPVGTFAADASAFGVLDMGGNVAEWTADWEDSQHTVRVIRGGDWRSNSEARVTAYNRNAQQPADRENWLGFRCAK